MNEERIRRLMEYADRLTDTPDKAALFSEFQTDLEQVTPTEVFEIQSRRLSAGMDHQSALAEVGMLINVFHKGLKNYVHKPFVLGGFLESLTKENNAVNELLLRLQSVIKNPAVPENHSILKEGIASLASYEIHMKKLENLLFPTLEKKHSRYLGTTIMWSLHDKIRHLLKEASAALAKAPDEKMLWDVFGRLYVNLASHITMQTFILLPASADTLSEQEDHSLLFESFEYGFTLIPAPEKPEKTEEEGLLPDGTVDLGTGILSVKELVGIFSSLPVDLTFVNAEDKVAFFSRPKDRIFPRSFAVIGRDVRNCHPAESVHIVEEILEGFRSGKRDSESFWIQMRGMFILIQYFAVRDADHTFLGTLEVSQEISHIRSLDGEKRLLDR